MKAVVVSLFFFTLFALSVCEDFYFEERFSDKSLDGWVVSKMDEANLGKFEVANPKEPSGDDTEQGLRTTEDAKFYRISRVFDKPLNNKDENLCVQFTVAHEQNIDCGGGYIKLFGKVFDPELLDGDTPYSIMFGPDTCGFDKSLVHLIFSHNQKNHLIKKEIPGKRDENTHLYTLILKPDNTFEVKIDEESVRTGSLSEDWDMLESKMIDDPSVSKPSDWVDLELIDDPEDKKPEDYDQPETIEDPDAKKPDDWDDEMDGDWARPTVPNPAFKGEWSSKKIPNPLFKGEWEHPQIPNPNFVDEPDLYSRTMKGVGFDIWQVKSGSLFGNLIISTNLKDCEDHAMYWHRRNAFEKNKAAEKEKKEAEADKPTDSSKKEEEEEGDEVEEAQEQKSEEKKHEEL